MISVEEALQRILGSLSPGSTETISIADAAGRVLARDLISRRTHPPRDASAMDGYAVRFEDVKTAPVMLTQIGEAPAGGSFNGTVGPGEAVRIFTGGPVPEGADTIVLQEDVDATGNHITLREAGTLGRHIRKAGLDLQEGQTGLVAGKRLTPRDISLIAAMNVPWVTVYAKPTVALLANGNELVHPGDQIGENQIISSNSLGLAALINQAGGIPKNLGIAKDDQTDLQNRARNGAEADILVTIGGASVGDHDLVQSSLSPIGLEVDFWKIAMRPGKPLMFGALGPTTVIGLPGNPVSAFVCAVLFLKPAIAKLQGQTDIVARTAQYPLGRDIAPNGKRQDYMRAGFVLDANGVANVVPFETQDSSMLSVLAKSDGLVIREPNAPAAVKGDFVHVLLLDDQ